MPPRSMPKVAPPAAMKQEATPALWHQYRVQVKRELEQQLRHNRELIAQLEELKAERP